MSDKKKSPWDLTFGSWGAFFLSLILYLIFNLNVYWMLGMLTAAIIVTIFNAIYVFFKKFNENKSKT